MLLPLILLLAGAAPLTPAQAAAPLGRPLAETMASGDVGFRSQDLDHDGFITLAEMVTRTAASGDAVSTAVAIARLYFEERDWDHDGRISLEEYKQNLARQFAYNDSDHDGLVTMEEQSAGIARDAESRRGALRAILNAPMPCLTLGLRPVVTPEQKMVCARQEQ